MTLLGKNRYVCGPLGSIQNLELSATKRAFPSTLLPNFYVAFVQQPSIAYDFVSFRPPLHVEISFMDNRFLSTGGYRDPSNKLVIAVAVIGIMLLSIGL